MGFDINKIVKKLMRIISPSKRKYGRLDSGTYFFNGSYPIFYVVENPSSQEELQRRLRILNMAIQSAVSSPGGQTGVSGYVRAFPGSYIGRPDKIILAFVFTFYGIDPETGRRIIYPDNVVRELALSMLDTVEEAIRLANFREALFFESPPSPIILKELGFDVTNFTTARKFVYVDDTYILDKLIGNRGQTSGHPTQYLQQGFPQPGFQQAGFPQAPQTARKNLYQKPGGSGSAMVDDFGTSFGNSEPFSDDESSVDVSDNFDISDSGADVDDVIPSFDDEEGGIGGKTNEFLDKMKLYDVMDEEGFDKKNAKKYNALDFLLLPNEIASMLRENVEVFKKQNLKYMLLEIGKTIDGSTVYLPYVDTMANHIAVFGQTGFGKSYGSGVILEELAYRGVPIIVIDVSSEWESLADLPNRISDEELADKYGNASFKEKFRFNLLTLESFTDYIQSTVPGVELKTFQLSLKELTPSDLQTLISVASEGTSRTSAFGIHQQTIIMTLFKRLKEGTLVDSDGKPIRNLEDLCNMFTMNEPKVILKLLGINENKTTLKAVETLASIFNILSINDSVMRMVGDKELNLNEIDRPNTVTVIRFPSLAEADKVTRAIAVITVQKLINKITAHRMMMYRKHKKIPYPLHFFLDEAHNYLKEEQLKALVKEKYAEETVALFAKTIKEVRKMGLSLHFSSQNPSDLPKPVLSQIPTVLFGSIPESDSALLKDIYGVTDDITEFAKNMRSQFHEFLMFSTYYSKNKPILMRFRKRYVA